MLKRTLIVLSVAVLGTAAIWLMPGQETVVPLPLSGAPDTSGPSDSSSSSGKRDAVEERGSVAGEGAGEDVEEKVPQSQRHAAGEIEKHRAMELRLKELKKAVIDQEMKVEEKRKILATIVRTKGIIYKGTDMKIDAPGQAPATDPATASAPVDPELQAELDRKDAEQRGQDAQDYVDAKRDFETDQELLRQMKLALEREREKLER